MTPDLRFKAQNVPPSHKVSLLLSLPLSTPNPTKYAPDTRPLPLSQQARASVTSGLLSYGVLFFKKGSVAPGRWFMSELFSAGN